MPAGSEFLDVISPQYLGDLIAWGAIGARTTESQVHRELASGLSAPIGFKNGTDGNIRIAIDAIQAAARPHHFLSVHKNGQVAIVETRGNTDCHVILRGGKAPNYDAAHRRRGVQARSRRPSCRCTLMVDCSHANSSKQHERQVEVARDVAAQLAGGSRCIFGVMVESHLQAGAQKFSAGKDDPAKLAYGQSITDACLGWDDSVRTLRAAERRGRGAARDAGRGVGAGAGLTAAASALQSRHVRPRSIAVACSSRPARVAALGCRRRAGARPAADDRRPVRSVARLPRPRARLGRRPDDRARPHARRPAAADGARRAPRPARRRSRRHGRAVDGAEIEIWQCDAFGSYRHPRGAGDRIDAGFQGFGAARTQPTRRQCHDRRARRAARRCARHGRARRCACRPAG